MPLPSHGQAEAAVPVAEVMAAFSLAADLGSGNGEEHGLRSTLVAVELGAALGLSHEDRRDLYDLSLLRMIGCTADSHLSAQALGDEVLVGRESAGLDMGSQREAIEWLFREFGRDLALQQRAALILKLMTYTPKKRTEHLAGHCEVAGMLASELGRKPRVVAALAQVFERWDGRGAPAGLRGEAIDVLARIVSLAVDVAIFAAVGGMEEAVVVCRHRAGGLHDPGLVDLLFRTSGRIAERLRSADIWAQVLAAEPPPCQILEAQALDRACAAMGAFADMKSVFTSGRSGRVEATAVEAGRRLGLSAAGLQRLRRAALMHDLGRVAVSTAIWDRPGRLSMLQHDQVRLFPLHGERILSRASRLRPEAALVGLQREALDGSGYPHRLKSAAIPLEARVLGTASAYVAMREARAWRTAFSHAAAIAELQAETRASRMDPRVVDAIAHRDAPRPRGRPRIEALSDRETEVLALLAAGCTNHEIGRRLAISARTVEHHIRSVYGKLGVRSRAAATLWAARAGLAMMDELNA